MLQSTRTMRSVFALTLGLLTAGATACGGTGGQGSASTSTSGSSASSSSASASTSSSAASSSSSASTGPKSTITFADWTWTSAQMHDRIAGFIIQHGYGHPVKYTLVNTAAGMAGLERGGAQGLQISMETWIDNFKKLWDKGVKSGKLVSLGRIYPDAPQGWYVPTYVIKGDKSRGIKPMAPNLTSVSQLSQDWKVFKSPTHPNQGRFYNCPSGWLCSKINEKKLKAYGLSSKIHPFDPGSQAALSAAVLSAYKQGKPILFYYWEPTWLLGAIKATQLKEPKYTTSCWNSNKGCAYPPSTVLVAVNHNVLKTAPKVVPFLKHYKVSLAVTEKALAYMKQHNEKAQGAAMWFLKNEKSLWESWVPASVKTKVLAALKTAG